MPDNVDAGVPLGAFLSSSDNAAQIIRLLTAQIFVTTIDAIRIELGTTGESDGWYCGKDVTYLA